MIRKILLASVAVIALPTAASAGNSGFYVGVLVGAGNSDASADYSLPNVWDTFYSTSPATGSSLGFAIGAQGGFDWAIGNSTWGVVADYTYLTSSVSRGIAWEECGSSCNGITKLSSQGLISIRGRYGFNVADGTMLYGTAGVGWIDANDNLNVGAGKGGNFKASKWTPALVIGGGLEQTIDDSFSIAGQVLYARSDTIKADPQDTSYFDPADNIPVYYRNNVVIATVNFNFHM